MEKHPLNDMTKEELLTMIDELYVSCDQEFVEAEEIMEFLELRGMTNPASRNQ